MRVATMVSSGKDLSFEEGRFVLDGQMVSVEKVDEYEGLGILQWVSPETKQWFDDLRSQPVPVAQAAPAAQPAAGPDPRVESESGRVDWAYRLGAWIGRNKVAAVVLAVIVGLVLLGGIFRIGGALSQGVGPGEAIGTAMPPNEVLVDGKTYIVFENKSGTDNIRRGDKVKVEFKDIDSDGENDMVNITELVSVAGQ